MKNLADKINNDIMGKPKKKKEPMVTGEEIKKYNVWVGDKKMTNHLITYSLAKLLLDVYKDKGHKKVTIVGVR
tara:strand:+ start:126 stop:344 length:219 start_codon:yes stop_codon:yes gene_type:complete